jgi:sarcosine oxidase subunit delta
MLLIRCPYCEQDRAEVEFVYAGEAHIERPRDPSALSDAEWEAFLFLRANPRGTHFERWCHIHGCARYFNAVRDTVSDKFLITYKAGKPRPTKYEIRAAKK